ncbi:MAG: zinc ribbon domain-containing protein [Lachnospiraceae bacterium]|nr:zinc ribbon domain-containing protein [Lachnospiraceae bacterium]
MEAIIIGLIIILVLILILILIFYIIYRNISKKVRGLSRAIWGTSSVSAGIKKMNMEYSTTPKSVSSATGLYLPRIVRDFPEFHYDEMKERAENVLISFLRGIDAQNVALLTEGTQELKDKLSMYVSMQKAQSLRSHYDKIKVHRTELHQYRKEKGRCSITFQSAVEFVYYTIKQGEVIAGRKDLKTQAKFNIKMIYIQDRDVIESMADAALGLNCPNCGAPLSGLGAKTCAYCDTPLIEFNIRVWNFSDVEEIK